MISRIALLAAAAFCFSTAAIAGDFRVNNESEEGIVHLYLSPASQDDWGDDQLGEGVLVAGESITLFQVADGRYDVKFETGMTVCVVSNVPFRGNMHWNITQHMLSDTAGCSPLDQ